MTKPDPATSATEHVLPDSTDHNRPIETVAEIAAYLAQVPADPPAGSATAPPPDAWQWGVRWQDGAPIGVPGKVTTCADEATARMAIERLSDHDLVRRRVGSDEWLAVPPTTDVQWWDGEPPRCDCDWPPEVPGIPHRAWCASLGERADRVAAAARAIDAVLAGASEPPFEHPFTARQLVRAAVEALDRAAQHGPECAEQDQAPTAAELLRLAAAGRREYAQRAPDDQARTLQTEANVFESAARIVEGDLDELRAWLPSWRWTDAGRIVNAPNGGTSPTLADAQPPARGIGCPDAQDGVQTVPESLQNPPDDDSVIVLDVDPHRLARLYALHAAEHGDIRGADEAVRRLDGPALNRFGATCRTLAQACEAEVLRRTGEADHG